MPLKCGLASYKVIENGIIQQIVYAFLFVFYSKYN